MSATAHLFVCCINYLMHNGLCSLLFFMYVNATARSFDSSAFVFHITHLFRGSDFSCLKKKFSSTQICSSLLNSWSGTRLMRGPYC